MPGTWAPLVTQPAFPPGTMLLLTDGTVLCQHARTNNWWRLAPDAAGSYVGGSWTAFASSPRAPTYYASAVLRDGRVFVAGGEDDGASNGVDLNLAWIFDPAANTWTSIPDPGWTAIGDAPACMMPDGRVLIGSIHGPQCAIYDPVSNSWTAAAAKHNSTTSEETWTLLADQTVLTVDCANAPQTEKYVIAANQWSICGNTPESLVEAASIEVGPAILLPDGRLFAIGATDATALYTPPAVSSQPGTWANGPSFPPQAGQPVGAKDAPAVLLPNGNVLCVVGPVNGVANAYLGPSYFFEFDPTTNGLAAVATPPNGGSAPYTGRMLLLPTGQVLFGSEAYSQLQVYTPTGAADPLWKPTITSCPTHLLEGGSFTLMGRQINGLSQANSYGDDAQMATNYPIVRLVYPGSGQVHYCRTSGHSTMAVNTGTVVHSTAVRVPTGIPTGAAQLSVIANGIASDPLAVSVSTFKLPKEIKEVKELKAELKEIKETVKVEHDGVKLVNETKTKDAENGVIVQQQGLDPALVGVVHQMARRLDQVEAGLAQQRALITPPERPAVGDAALQKQGG